MRRNFIVLGDKTTADGVVLQGEERSQHHGKPLAYEGAAVSCHACKSTGHIQCVEPLHPMKLFGKQVALENDLCICQCNPPPKLVATQQAGYMAFDTAALAKASLEATQISGNPAELFDDHYALYGKSGASLAGVRYAIVRENGSTERGTTDAKGHTHLLSTTAQAEHIQVYVET